MVLAACSPLSLQFYLTLEVERIHFYAMGKIEWSMWANAHAISSACIVTLGGILATAERVKYWELGVYAVVIGVLTVLLEYPRGKRQHGSSHERKFQRPLTVLVSYGKLITRNYFIRFVIYLVVSVPCCFILPTLLGAICYMTTSFIYLVAGIKGEEWLPIETSKEEHGPKIIEEPQRPPPRRPDVNLAGDNRQEANSRV